jgi:large subunit ribosomal protein L20
MSRSPRAVPSHARRKKVFKQTKGMRGRRKNNITTANAAADKSLQHNYIGRKEKKRNFRALWIQRINAAVREHGLTYGRFINGLTNLGIEVDRKVLSDIAINDPAGFKALVDKAAKAASSPVAKADQDKAKKAA